MDDLLVSDGLPSLPEIQQRIDNDEVLAGRQLSSRAVATTLLEWLSPTPRESKLQTFQDKLAKCPTGQSDFAKYEKIGIEIWDYLFWPELAFIGGQLSTADGVYRTDAIFRNDSDKRIWQRIRTAHSAAFVILDFKNDGKPITPNDIQDASKYANDRLGRFIVVLSRKGAARTKARQARLLSEDKIATIVVSDDELLEMVCAKEQGRDPGSFVEKLYDTLLQSS